MWQNDVEFDSNYEIDSDSDSFESVNDITDSTSFKLAICEIYHPALHGHVAKEKQVLYGHYLAHLLIRNNNRWIERNSMIAQIELLSHLNSHIGRNIPKHSFIRNYNTITNNGDSRFRHEIIKPIYLQNGGEMVAILKTFWIKIIQRAWKRVYAERIAIVKNAKGIINLRSREIGGKYLSKLERNYPKFTLGFKF